MKDKKKEEWNLRDSQSFNDSQGLFQIWGGIFPFHWIVPVFYCVVGYVHCGFFLYTAILTIDELLILIECANYFMILATTSTIQLTFLFSAKHMAKAYRKFDEGLCNYSDTLDEKSTKEIEIIKIESLKTRKRIMSMLKSLLITILIILGFLRPVYKYFKGDYVESNYSKDINRNLPVVMWVPYNSEEWLGFILIMVTEYYLMISSLVMVIGATGSFVFFGESIDGELKVLQATIGNLIRRAKHVAKITGQSTITKEILDKCIGKSIEHHQNIIALFQYFLDGSTWVLWSAATVATFMICFNGFVCSDEEVEFLAKAISAVVFVTMIIMMYLLCIYGESMQSLSSTLGYKLYTNDWLAHSLVLKQQFLIIQTISLKPLILSGGHGLIEANLGTFSNIMSSAYSYFNLLRASRSS